MDVYSVDRIENDIAVIICGKKVIEISLEKLPKDIKEGSVLIKTDSGEYIIDKQETSNRKKMMNSLQNSLFK